MNYHNITHDDMLNGLGLRVVLWVSGCTHQCEGCHNKETWDFKSGIPFDKEAKEEIFNELKHDYIKGITFSGGDPLHLNNIKTIKSLILEIKDKFPDKDIWIYTGYVWEDIKHLDFMEHVDIIVDGPFRLDLKNTDLKFKGSSNQRIIDVKESLQLGIPSLLF